MTWLFSMKLEILTTECPGTGLGSQQQHEFLPHMPLVYFVGLSKYFSIPRLGFLTGAQCCASGVTQVSQTLGPQLPWCLGSPSLETT